MLFLVKERAVADEHPKACLVAVFSCFWLLLLCVFTIQ